MSHWNFKIIRILLTESGVNAKCQSRILVFEVSVDWRRTGPAYPITIRVLEVFAPSCNLRHFLLKYLHNMVYIFVCVLKRNKQDIRNDQSIFDTSCELLLLVIAYTIASQQMASKYHLPPLSLYKYLFLLCYFFHFY